MYNGRYKILHLSIKKDGSIDRSVIGVFTAAADEILSISGDISKYIDGDVDANSISKAFANSPYFLIVRANG